jgi:hypothetical protein
MTVSRDLSAASALGGIDPGRETEVPAPRIWGGLHGIHDRVGVRRDVGLVQLLHPRPPGRAAIRNHIAKESQRNVRDAIGHGRISTRSSGGLFAVTLACWNWTRRVGSDLPRGAGVPAPETEVPRSAEGTGRRATAQAFTDRAFERSGRVAPPPRPLVAWSVSIHDPWPASSRFRRPTMVCSFRGRGS